MTKVNPLSDHVVAVREKPKEQTKSGLFLPEASLTMPMIAIIESVGSEVKGLKVGDHIVYREYATTDLKIEDQEFLIIKEEDVLATL